MGGLKRNAQRMGKIQPPSSGSLAKCLQQPALGQAKARSPELRCGMLAMQKWPKLLCHSNSPLN